MAVHLVCEGFRGGLDERVLDAVVIQFHTLSVLTAPAGGSSGLGSVRHFLESRTLGDVAIAVRDRDYDRTLADVNATWATRSGREFIWRRHEIENYLLQPQVVLELFNDWRKQPALTWATGLPSTEADVDTLLQQLAIPLIDSHAAELLRAELTQATNTFGSVRFTRPNPPVPPGAHVPGQAQWLPALVTEAARLCGACSTIATLPQLQSAAITLVTTRS